MNKLFALLLALLLLTSCVDYTYKVGDRVCVDGLTRGVVMGRWPAKPSMSFTAYPMYEIQYINNRGDYLTFDSKEDRMSRDCK